MQLKDIVNITKGIVINNYNVNKKVKGFSIDTRTIKKGEVFVALKGKQYDGHDYLKEALNKKISAVIVEDEILIDTKIPIIKVEDTYKAMGTIAKFNKDCFDIPVIAVTGSVGKTMTKDLIADILSLKYKVLKSKGNRNNKIGLPLTLFELNKKHDIAVVELGMNHLGEIKELVNICKPDVAVITNVGTAHIGNLGSQKNIFKAKCEILDNMKDKQIVLNGDDKFLKKIKNKKNKIYFTGMSKNCDLVAFNIVSDFQRSIFTFKINNKSYVAVFNVPGNYLINNVLLAIQVGLIFDINIKDIIEVVANYNSKDKRMEILEIGSNILIDDCYNASYESVISAINLTRKEEKNKIIILGDILELGRFSKMIHKKIGRELSKLKNSKILLVGKGMSVNQKYGKHFENNKALINYLEKENIENTIILIKGSRGMQLEEVVDYFIN